MAVSFAGDLSAGSIALPHFWEHTIGSGHATLALRADWQAQLRRTHAELGMAHVRFHGLLSDDVGTLIEKRTHCSTLFSTLTRSSIFCSRLV